MADLHPSSSLDTDVHQRVRLGILAVLNEVDEADFSYLAKTLGLTDGNLSRNLTALEEKGYVKITKVFEGRRPRTWVKATREGAKAFRAEVDTLRAIVALADRAKK